MTTQLVEDLTTARDLIAAGRWVQGEYARPVDGVACFCAVGAIKRAVGIYTDEVIVEEYGDGSPGDALVACGDFRFNMVADRQEAATDVLASVLPPGVDVPEQEDGNPPPSGVPVVRWNDTEGRTREEVVAAFDRAIEQASQQ